MFNWEEDFTKASLEESVRRCVKVYGLEGTEQKAKDILGNMPTFRDKFLDTLYRLYNFGERKQQ